uniref:Uncharacterized protein n=1 Tax=Lygus hesperus TaxID=30085 RepID=A0A146MCT3_LYGHE
MDFLKLKSMSFDQFLYDQLQTVGMRAGREHFFSDESGAASGNLRVMLKDVSWRGRSKNGNCSSEAALTRDHSQSFKRAELTVISIPIYSRYNFEAKYRLWLPLEIMSDLTMTTANILNNGCSKTA